MHILKPFLGKMKNVNTKHVLEQSYETFPAKRNYGCRNQPTLNYSYRRQTISSKSKVLKLARWRTIEHKYMINVYQHVYQMRSAHAPTDEHVDILSVQRSYRIYRAVMAKGTIYSWPVTWRLSTWRSGHAAAKEHVEYLLRGHIALEPVAGVLVLVEAAVPPAPRPRQ